MYKAQESSLMETTAMYGEIKFLLEAQMPLVEAHLVVELLSSKNLGKLICAERVLCSADSVLKHKTLIFITIMLK